MSSLKQPSVCHCGSGKSFLTCCQPYVHGGEVPATAEALMRSRYTAYVLEDESYLLATWHADTRPHSLHFDQTPRPHWLGLKVMSRRMLDETHAIVEFVARYKINGRAFRIHETSRFEQIAGRWYYRDGELA